MAHLPNFDLLLNDRQEQTRNQRQAYQREQRGAGFNANRQLTDYSDYYEIGTLSERKSHKFKTASNVYHVKFKHFSKDALHMVSDVLDDVLRSIKNKLQCEDRDKMRVNIQHPSLKSEVWVEFTDAKDLNADLLMEKIEKVQQSNENFRIDDGSTTMSIIHVMQPVGSGGGKRKHHLSFDKNILLQQEKSVI